jgi:hypothetical protein
MATRTLFRLTAFSVLCLAASVQIASAQAGRVFTPRLPCAAARQLVAREGAVILSTGGGRYDRYVSNEGACPAGLNARPAWVPTADTQQCPVGYYCSSAPPPSDF